MRQWDVSPSGFHSDHPHSPPAKLVGKNLA